MRHRVAGRKFGLPSDQRRALLKGLVRSLIIHKKIETTETRAKDVRAIAEKMVTRAKQDTLHARRVCRQYIGGVDGESVIKELFDNVAPRFRDRPGGYTRMAKLGVRRGDGSPMVILELADD
jgi:large subunit ribosomal protein L17